MTKQEYLRQVRKQIYYVFDRNVIEEELNQHLEDNILDLLEEGHSPEDAEQKAVAQMGDPIETGKQLNREHHPLLGYLSVILTTLLIPIGIYFGLVIAVALSSTISQLTPTTIDSSIEEIDLDITLDISTHRVKIDKICLSEYGDYYITYRSWTKFNYSRAGCSSYLFNVEDTNGIVLTSGGGYSSHSPFGEYGGKSINFLEDPFFYIVTANGQKIPINLEDYSYETSKKNNI